MKKLKFTLPDGTTIEYTREAKQKEDNSDYIFAIAVFVIIAAVMIAGFALIKRR